MRRIFSLLLATLVFSGSAFSQENKLPRAQRELATAERAFARYCVEHGLAESWMEFFADDGVIFRPGPVNAKDFYRPRLPTPKPLTSTLDWEPRYGDVSQAGDLGYDYGPWNYVARLPQPEEAHGYFFSIWKKQADGTWKVALDMGAGEVPAATADHVFGKPFTQARQYKSKVPSDSNAPTELRRLTEMDRGFAERAKSAGALDAYLALVAVDAKTFQKGRAPAGKDSLRSFIPASKDISLALWPIGGGVAKSSDLAYTYGSYGLLDRALATEKGYYLHMWKRDEAGVWKIVVTNFSKTN
jgi:ketosteroid isomerase-like protein